MAITTTPALLETLRQLPLLEAAQKAELAALQIKFPDPRALARELIQRDWLTPYQVNLLLQGRGSDLILGPYVLLARLGEGGMGTVYKARHTQMRRLVALKVMRKERLANPTAVRRFENEITAAAQMVHPHIVVAFDTGQVRDIHYFSMEYLDGVDLNQLVKQKGPLPARVACEYMRQVALGLQHAHEHGLIHRDIKPHNLLLQPPRPGTNGAGTVKILDLGLARLGGPLTGDGSTEVLTQDGAILGTPDYIAPEQARAASNVDVRADLYSLGCVFYFLLTGQPPFPGGAVGEKLIKHQLDAPARVEKLRPEVPADVAALVHKLLAKRPEDRFQTPKELADALAAVLAGGQVKPSALLAGPGGPSALPAAGRELLALTGRLGKWLVSARWGRRVLAGSLGVLVLLLLVVWLKSPRSGSPGAGPSLANLQYVKGKNRQETILATLSANRLPSLEGNLYFLGPFADQTQYQGFNTVYPPEREYLESAGRIDLARKYTGREGLEVAWKAHPALPLYTEGRLDFANLLPNVNRGSGCYYTYQRLEAAAATSWPVAVAQGHPSKLWLNGAPVPALQGRYTLELKAGTNDLLAKVCNTSMAGWQVGFSSQLENAFGLRLELDNLEADHGRSNFLEGEGLKVLQQSSGFPIAPLDMRDTKGSWWSSNAQLQARSGRPGEWAELEVPVGNVRRHLSVYLTRGPEHGIVQFSVNGIPLGDRIDLYADQVANTGVIELGTVPGSVKSPVALRVEVVGSNAKATGVRHGWGLDCLVWRAK